jgi:hypothetical protein
MDTSGENVFSLGVYHAPRQPHPRIRFRRLCPQPTIDDMPAFLVWAPQLTNHYQTPPAPGMIRMLQVPEPSTTHICWQDWWARDRTLTDWLDDIDIMERDLSANTLASAFMPPGYITALRDIFLTNQRQRWLARWVVQRLRYRMWRRRAQCAVDLIEMSPVSEHDAIYLMDTHVRCVYCFHRRDVFHNLLSNLSMADEMFPTPRSPTNPWTNAPLTLAQTISVCQQLMMAWGRIGRAPTVLFAAFCASKYDVERMRSEHSSLLGQEAIRSFFKDLTNEVQGIVYDTMMQIFADMGLTVSPVAVRRWLRSPLDAQHRAWLQFVRDYTLYINLHVQVRPGWTDEDAIHVDAARLLASTELPDTTSVRLRNLRLHTEELRAGPLLSQPLSLPLQMSLPLQIQMIDGSGNRMQNVMDLDLAMQLLQSALLRF